MKRMLVCLTLAVFVLTGCAGSFRATRSVNNLPRSQSNRWLAELIFLGCTPLYGVAIVGDAVLFNTIEFWSGRNPLKLAQVDSRRLADASDSRAIVRYNDVDDSIRIQDSSLLEKELILQRSACGVTARDASGRLLFCSSQDQAGWVAVYDGNMKLIRYAGAQEVLARSHYLLDKTSHKPKG